MSEEGFTGAMRILAGLLETRTGQILSENRLWRIETVLKPLLRERGIDSLETLASQLLTSSDRVLEEDVVNALLNNESSFFRDAPTFSLIEKEILPHLHETIKNRRLNIWCAGCSHGQEAFSLAMMLRKSPMWADWRISITATDISSAAISRARSGTFSQIDVQRGLPITELLRWFEPAGEEWMANGQLRDLIDFRVDNLLDSAVAGEPFDLILCRNVLIYFSLEMRQKVFATLAKRAAPNSLLILGAGETVIGQTEDFAASRRFRGSYERGDGERAPLRARAG